MQSANRGINYKNRMKNIFLHIAVSISFAFAFSCNNSKKIAADASVVAGSGSEMLYRYQWDLMELGSAVVPSITKAHLLFTGGQPKKVSGNTGCNLLNGSFELNGSDGIKFSAFATTRRACIDNPSTDVETKFLKVLGQTAKWSIRDSVLILSNGNTVLAKLKAVNPSAEN